MKLARTNLEWVALDFETRVFRFNQSRRACPELAES
jgi:hypothetical protein